MLNNGLRQAFDRYLYPAHGIAICQLCILAAFASLITAPALTAPDLHRNIAGPPEAPDVLLLHGWGGSTVHMQPVAKRLADRYRTHCIDLPGHGHSPPPPASWGVPEHAALVADYIKAEATPPLPIIGHSNGGRIALYMASHASYADLVKQLVLLAPSGITPKRALATRLKGTLARTVKTPFTWLPEPLQSPALDWLHHSLLWQALGSSDYNALSGVMRSTFVRTVNHHLDNDVHRITVPTLVFRGEDDTAISDRQVQYLVDHIPDAGRVDLPGDHYAHLHALDTVAAAVRHVLAHPQGESPKAASDAPPDDAPPSSEPASS
jgi:pimeloyl-ACP methyl ester carboxylesterase